MNSVNCIIIVTIIISSAIFTEANGVKRIYGTHKDRHRERICKQSLICQYRAAQCITVTPENQWTCNRVLDAINTNRCTLEEKCEGDDRSCAATPADNSFVKVHSDYCPIGQHCYVMANTTVTTTVVSILSDNVTSNETGVTTSPTVTSNTTEALNVTEAPGTANATDSGVTSATVANVTGVTNDTVTNGNDTVTVAPGVTEATVTGPVATTGSSETSTTTAENGGETIG